MERGILKNEPDKSGIGKIWIQLCWQGARLGATGKIGLGFTVIAVIFFIGMVLPQDQTLKELKLRAETMNGQSMVQQRGRIGTDRKLSGDQALKIFYDFFPRIDSSPFWIGEIVRVAEMHKVEINSSEFHMTLGKDSRLARYEMVLPVRGRYPQIRAFIADALQSVPAMAIVGINMKRKNIQSTKLEAGLKVNLYLNDGQDG